MQQFGVAAPHEQDPISTARRPNSHAKSLRLGTTISSSTMSSRLSPSVTHSPLPYHEVSAARLLLVTTSGLVASGIPAEAMG